MIYTFKKKKRSISNKRKETERITIIDISDTFNEKIQSKNKPISKPLSKTTKRILILIGVMISLCTIIILFCLLFTMNKKIKSEANTEKIDFVINTENNSFSQYLMKSSQKHDSISNLINSSFSVFT